MGEAAGRDAGAGGIGGRAVGHGPPLITPPSPHAEHAGSTPKLAQGCGCALISPAALALNCLWARGVDRGRPHPQLRGWARDPVLANRSTGTHPPPTTGCRDVGPKWGQSPPLLPPGTPGTHRLLSVSTNLTALGTS